MQILSCPTCHQPWPYEVPTPTYPLVKRTRVLVAEDSYGHHQQLYITDVWTREQGIQYAKDLGFKPLCIVTVKDKRHV